MERIPTFQNRNANTAENSRKKMAKTYKTIKKTEDAESFSRKQTDKSILFKS